MSAEIKTVIIPDQNHNPRTVRLRWKCPVCGASRGEPVKKNSLAGIKIHGWVNQCGHIDYYTDVNAEANGNGLNK